MSDGHATADGELSTSDTAITARGDRTHAPAVAQKSDDARQSTRRPESTVEKTVIGQLTSRDDGDHSSAVQANTLITPDGTQPGAGDDDFMFGATVVGHPAAPTEDGEGYEYGATVLPEEDATGATRIAEADDSFDGAQAADHLDVHPGESLIGGKFRVIKTLGEGSFGSVYLAHDPQLDRRVAIKVTKVGILETRSDVDRFQREAKAAAQLRHPNIVPVYDTGRMGRSSYLVYEFIDGRTLGSRLKEAKKLPPREAAQLMRSIAGALGYAHELGIIHRDMKPDNVLLDNHGQPHIADFGLARRDSGEMDKTREGGLMGTPLYMSPEQAAGRSHEADARTDVWSLGVMLREMLTGVLPFKGKLTEILIAVQNFEPPGIRTLDRKLPKDLATICQKCLSKDPALRYANGTELAAELDRYLRGEPILARPLSAPARLARWVKRNPKVALFVGLFILALSLGLAFSSYFAVVANQKNQLAIQSSKEKALTQLQSLKTATPGGLSPTLRFLKDSRDDIATQLDADLAELDEDVARGLPRHVERNRLLLAKSTLFPDAPGQQERLTEIAQTLAKLTPDELLHQVEIVEQIDGNIVPTLQQIAHDPDPDRPVAEKRSALYALTRLAPESPDWDADALETAAGLQAARLADLNSLLTLVRPIRDQLLKAIEPQFTSQEFGTQAAYILASLFADRPEMLYTDYVRRATYQQMRALIEPLSSNVEQVLSLARVDLAGAGNESLSSEARLRMQTNAFLVTYAVTPESLDWDRLASGTNNTLRTEIIQALHQAVAQWQAAAERLQHEPNPSVRQALLQALSQYSDVELTADGLGRLRTLASDLFQNDPSPAVHSAARLFLERNGGGERVKQLLLTPSTVEDHRDHNWFRNAHSQEFAIVRGPVEFQMGASPDDVNQVVGLERQHLRQIPRSFAVGMREITVAEYQQFNPDHFYNPAISPSPECPMTELSWIDAAKYCRWLSEQEGIPEEEMCFPPIDQIVPGITIPNDFLQRTGYRLPTSAEWEFACRAGTTTVRWMGTGDQAFIGAWFLANSEGSTHPVGIKEPNPLGLFDSLGNVLEYCQEFFFEPFPESPDGQPVIDGTDSREGYLRELRSGSYAYAVTELRASYRDGLDADNNFTQAGFRLARTIREE